MASMIATSDTLLSDSAAASHTGMVRLCNEDNLLSRPAIGLWAVADGMGGHQAGDLASQIVVDALAQIVAAESPARLLQACEATLESANRAVRSVADSQGLGIIGATVATLLVYGRHFACVWSGDSRIYLARHRQMLQLTRDHTEVQDLLDRGVLTPAEASVWPRREVITRAIGVSEQLELEQIYGHVEPGDVFVLCSDGLTAHVKADEILAIVDNKEAAVACQELIDLTLSRGAHDNVTVIVIRYRAVPIEHSAEHPSQEIWE
jgi:serine/threonine protein phosphatase PrpC